MTIFKPVLDQYSISDSNDLPSPDACFPISRENDAGIKLSRSVPDISDSGRISFGASCRITVRN